MSDQTIRWPGQQPGQESPFAIGETKERMPTVVLPGAAQTLQAFGDEVLIHLGGAETGGNYTVFTSITPPGGGPPPHYHKNEDEWFLPLEGRVEFFLDGSWKEVPLGSLVFVPRDMVHTFRNCGDRPSKILTQTAPSGFEIFFERCAAEFAKSSPPDMDRIIEISAEHGIHYVMD